MLTGTKLSLPWAPGNWTLTTSSHFYHPKAYPFPVPNSSLSPQTRCCAWLLSRVQLFVTPWTAALQAPLSMGILQARILEWVAMPPSRDLPNPGIPNYRQILYCLSHQGSPRILEWVAYPFSRGSSQPWDQTQVSCISGRFFTV